MKHALFLASLVLIAGSAVGCGGDDKNSGGGTSAPDNASTSDFCTAFGHLFTGISNAGDTPDSDAIQAFKTAAKELGDVGTPDGIADDARHGFELFVNALEDLDTDATAADLENLGKNFSKDDEADMTAFIQYAIQTCPDALGGALPSDLPTDLPTDVPSS
jgi:soluble cytochrome b562